MHSNTYDEQGSESALRRQQAEAEASRQIELARSASLQETAEISDSASTVASTGRRTLPDQTLRAMSWYNISVYNPHLSHAPHPLSQGWCWFERCPNPDTAIRSVDVGSYPTMSGMVMRRPELHQACHTTLYEPFIASNRTETTLSPSQQITEGRNQ